MARDRNIPNKGDVQAFNGLEWVPLSFMQAAVAAGFLMLVDAITYFIDDLDNTKRVRLQLSGLTTGTDRQWSFPDRDDTFAGLGAQTFTGTQTFVATTQSGNWTQTGATAIVTGTGAATLNGHTTVAVDKRFSMGGASTGAVINVSSSSTATAGGGVNQYGILDLFVSGSDATSITCGMAAGPTTLAAAYTTGSLVSFWANFTAPALGAGSSATRTAGVAIQQRTVGGTANHGIYYGTSTALAGSGNYFIYNNTTDPVYLGGGQTSIIATTDATSTITGSLTTLGGGSFAKNIIGGQGLGLGVSSTVTAAGTTTLTNASRIVQKFTGTTTQTVQFPAANIFGAGVAVYYTIDNHSTGTVTPTRAGSDTFKGGGTTFPVAGGASTTFVSDGVSVWGVE